MRGVIKQLKRLGAVCIGGRSPYDDNSDDVEYKNHGNDKKVGNYGGGGAVQKLHPRKAPTLAIIKVIIKAIILITHVIFIPMPDVILIFIPMPTMQELREGLWIDRATRLIIIDFTLYNANINMFCIAKVPLTLKPIKVTCR